MVKRGDSSLLSQAALILVLGLFSLSVLYPMLNVLSISLSDSGAVMRGEVTAYPKGFTLKAYEYMLQYNLIGSGYLNSLFLLVVGTSINLIMTALTAYALSRKTLVGRKLFMMLIIFTMMFNGGLIPNYILMVDMKLIDKLWSLVLPGAISAYNLIILKNFFESLPEELKESARIDGLSEMGILTRIVIPLSLPAVCTIALFYAVAHWNSYFNATIYINSRYRWPLQVVLRDLIQNANAQALEGIDPGTTIPVEPLKMAVVVSTTLPILLIYPFIQKYFVKGVMVGSLKG